MRDWDSEIEAIQEVLADLSVPSVNQIRSANAAPWAVLVSTIISLRTRDAVTLAASSRLMEIAPDPASLLAAGEKRTAELIYPAGFYRRKAASLTAIAEILIGRYDGRVPDRLDELMSLPGVGLKTANLVLGLGFGIPAICVDIHVHRIANRAGWIRTDTPDESERRLREVLPRKWWIDINRILVRFGQSVCTPLSPRCSACPASGYCPRIGVVKQR